MDDTPISKPLNLCAWRAARFSEPPLPSFWSPSPSCLRSVLQHRPAAWGERRPIACVLAGEYTITPNVCHENELGEEDDEGPRDMLDEEVDEEANDEFDDRS